MANEMIALLTPSSFPVEFRLNQTDLVFNYSIYGVGRMATEARTR